MSDNSDFVLRCENLAKTFSELSLKVDVLVDINLKVSPGEQIAIMGASGVGKSTLLHLLGGLDLPTSGNIFINNQNIALMNEAQRGRMRNKMLGFVYQFHHLLPEFTAVENVSMPLLIRGLPVKEAHKSAEYILNRVGLGARTMHKPSELSGGERQRVAIARALVTRPKCVLADEPTGNLDQKTAQRVYDMMLELHNEMNTSFIVVTHDSSLAARMSRILTIQDGCLVDADSP